MSNIRQVIRSILRRPAFSVAVIFLLGLGIVLNAGFFTVFHGVLLRPLEYSNPELLFTLWEENVSEGKFKSVVSPANYLDWRARSRTFSKMAAYLQWNMNFTGSDIPERIPVALVHGDFFEVLQTAPLHGRALTASDSDHDASVVVLSHGFWQRHFGKSPSAVGKSIQLSDHTYSIVGILPAQFAFPDSEVQAWVPYNFDPAEITGRTGNYLSVIARMKHGSTDAQARAELRTIADQLARQYPSTNRNWTVQVVQMLDEQVQPVKVLLRILFGAVVLVLLISCSNAANLLLSRSAGRQREFAIRSAIGASKWDLVWLTVLEGTILAMIAGVLALVILSLGIEGLLGLLPEEMPRLQEIRFDFPVILFTVVVSLFAGLQFSIVPALFQSRTDLRSALEAGGRVSDSRNVRSARSLFVAVQISLAVVLLSCALMLLQSLLNLQRVDLGFQLKDRIAFNIWLPRSRYPDNSQQAEFFDRMIERLEAIPGVQNVGAIQDLPLRRNKMTFEVILSGKSSQEVRKREIAYRTFSGNYFRTMGIRLIRGAAPDRYILTSNPVVWVNQSAADAFWRGEDPIGKALHFAEEERVLTVAGVVADVKHMGASEEQEGPVLYQPHSQKSFSFLSWMTIVIHTNSEPASLLAAIRQELKKLDPRQPMFGISTFHQIFNESIERSRISTFLITGFAALAILLTCAGIYSVVQYSVAQRTREIGIRMALGARSQNLIRMLFLEGSKHLLIGLCSGALLTLVLSRYLRGFLFQVQPLDVISLGLSILMITLSVWIAIFIPARRASQVEPLAALRYE